MNNANMLRIAMTSEIWMAVIQNTSVGNPGDHRAAAARSLQQLAGVFWTERKETLLNERTSRASTHSSGVLFKAKDYPMSRL